MFRAYVLFNVIVLATAQIPSIGFCPDYLPMSDFDIDSFLGKWYEAERYFQFSEVASRCVVTDYAKGPSGKIYVSNEVTNRLTGVKRIIDGHLELAGRIGEGKLNVKYSTTPLSSQATLTILDTDYDNYAVIWSCSGFGVFYAQSVWVMTRERLPPGPVLQQVYGVLDKFKISRSFFVKTDQEGCALAASDINAANGITAQSTVIQATGQPQRKAPFLGDTAGEHEVVESADVIMSTENNLHTFKSGQNNSNVIKTDQVKIEEIESINEHKNFATVNNLATNVAQAVAEPVKNVAVNSDIVKTELKSEVLENSIPDNEKSPLQIPGVLIKSETEIESINKNLKSETKLVPEKLSAPAVPKGSQGVEIIEDKVKITETKTN